MDAARRSLLVTTLCLLVLPCTSGCAALQRFEEGLEAAGIARFHAPLAAAGDGGRAVAIEGHGPEGRRVGRGAVIGPDRVLTVAHVVDGCGRLEVAVRRRGGWVRARAIERIPQVPEDLVVLALEVDAPGPYADLFGFSGFPADATFRPSADGRPQQVLLARGPRRWERVALRPGDSGSPVVDARGALVGLVSGRCGDLPVLTPCRPAAGELARRASPASYLPLSAP
ncbi:MAG: serine protease [Planctomycetota bacterium]|nr:MAG: serine protease [Planctomycetota bacterium]